MNTNVIYVFITILFLSLFTTYFLAKNNKNVNTPTTKISNTSKSIVKVEGVQKKDSTSVNKVYNKADLAKVIDYSPKILSEYLGNNKNRVVLFFSANWCPSCKIAEKDIRQNITQLPSDLIIIKVDYDKEKDLKTKYGVTYQDTFVQLDSAGNKIIMWNSGGAGIASFKRYLK